MQARLDALEPYVDPREEIDIETVPSEEEDKLAGPPTYDLLTYPADFTLEVLATKFAAREIIVPEMQRRYVWNQPQASRLVESFLLGLPIPPIYLYSEHGTERLLVVDGQQRLRSLSYFFSGLFGEEDRGRRTVFRLKLDEKSRYHDRTFNDLPEEDQRRLKNSVLRSFIMKQINPNDSSSIYHAFERLNTGGTLLSPQEVRNCIYDGSFNRMLHEANLLPPWRAIVGKQDVDKRFRDIELILRFLALWDASDKYEKPMKDFLSKFMSEYRGGQRNEEFQQVFSNTAAAVHQSLGDKPFHIKAGLNAAVFDAVFVASARHLGNLSAETRKRYRGLVADGHFLGLSSSGTTDVETIKDRIAMADKQLFGG